MVAAESEVTRQLLRTLFIILANSSPATKRSIEHEFASLRSGPIIDVPGLDPDLLKAYDHEYRERLDDTLNYIESGIAIR